MYFHTSPHGEYLEHMLHYQVYQNSQLWRLVRPFNISCQSNHIAPTRLNPIFFRPLGQLKDDWTRPLLVVDPQAGRSSSWWVRGRFLNVEGVSWHTFNCSPTLAARFQPVTILCCDGTGASRRKLTKAKSIYSRQNTKLQRNVAVV